MPSPNSHRRGRFLPRKGIDWCSSTTDGLSGSNTQLAREHGTDDLRARALRGPLCVLSSLAPCAGGRLVMRWFHISVIVLFIAATLLFAVQNFEMITMSFLGFSARAPLALLVAVVYFVGMATGGSLLALLRRSVQGSRRTPT